jgi:hypothetical protein
MRAGSSHKGIGLDDPAYPLRLAVIATGSRERSRQGSDMFLVLRAETCAKAGCDAAALRGIEQTVAICRDTGGRWAPRCCALRPGGIGRLTLPRRPQGIATSGADHNIYSGHRNSAAINAEHEIYAGPKASVAASYGYNDAPGDHAFGSSPG